MRKEDEIFFHNCNDDDNEDKRKRRQPNNIFSFSLLCSFPTRDSISCHGYKECQHHQQLSWPIRELDDDMGVACGYVWCQDEDNEVSNVSRRTVQCGRNICYSVDLSVNADVDDGDDDGDDDDDNCREDEVMMIMMLMMTISEFGIPIAHASVWGHSTKQAFSTAELAREEYFFCGPSQGIIFVYSVFFPNDL